MKHFLLGIAIIFCSQNIFSQDVNTLLKEAEKLMLLPNEKAAFLKYNDVLKQQPNNLIALTKSAELCSNIGNREANAKARDNYYKVAMSYAKTAYKLYPANDEANVAMAIAQGRIILLKSGKEKIAAVKALKMYAENATTANPKNYKAWHILGKWNYEVSSLNSLERSAAKLFYGALPSASLSNAIANYEKAKSLSNTFLLNHLELAKAYKKNGDKIKAVAELNYLLTQKNISEDDAQYKIEATTLLKKWQ